VSRQSPRPAGIEAIAIGASAGGAEALSTLLSRMPAHAGVSLFVVLHLPRNRPSLLVEIFRKRCALTLYDAFDKQPIERDSVYFAPPDYHMLVDEGPCIALSIDAPVCFSRPSIDVLFQSAAAVYRERLLGIVLTGANDDGAAGLRAIRDAGGATIVQDPADARVSIMPAAALQRVPEAAVMSLDAIADVLMKLRSEVSA
jgi:two-component system chemotaxis response regulator CheB